MSLLILQWGKAAPPVTLGWVSPLERTLELVGPEDAIYTINGFPEAPPAAGGGGGGTGGYLEWPQVSAQPTWVIPHNLGKFPDVTVIDLDGEELWATVVHLSNNVVQIEFSQPTVGKAILLV